MNAENPQPDAGNQALTDALNASFRVLRWVMALLLLAYLLSGVFIVRQDQKAFVTVFGKFSGTGGDRLKGPGIHWTLPPPFADVANVPAERVQSLGTESFWYYQSDEDLLAGKPSPPAPTLRPGRDGCTLTGDANLIHSKWVLRYTVRDPIAFLVGFQSPLRAVRNELDHAILKTCARYPVDRALRTDLEAFRAAAEAELRARCDALGMGIRIERLDLVSIVPPRQVADAFDAVVAAEQDGSRRISEARAEASRMLNQAAGLAARTRAEGETYKRRMISETRADAEYFDKVYEKYRENPEVTARTLLQDTLRRALSGVEQKYVIYKTATGEQELRLQLSPETKKK